MEYITETEYEHYLSKIDKYKKHCEGVLMPCAICGEKSTTHVWSMVGSFKWYMCDKHKDASCYLGGGGMGVRINGEYVQMKYLPEQAEINNQLKDL